MNVTSKEKQERLYELFKQGVSTRAAAKAVGVSKPTANRWRLAWGGMDHFRELGATFKLNRFK